jgi:hypothetical protein
MQISISSPRRTKKVPCMHPQYEFITRRGVRIRLSHLCIHFHGICMQRVEFKYNENVHTQTSRLISLALRHPTEFMQQASQFSSGPGAGRAQRKYWPGANTAGWNLVMCLFREPCFYWETRLKFVHARSAVKQIGSLRTSSNTSPNNVKCGTKEIKCLKPNAAA